LGSAEVEAVREHLRELAREAWEQHRRADQAALPHLVRPSIPILFFGDSERFASSPRHVITVGLNPSREEFPRAAPFLRFPGSAALNGDDLFGYLASLNAYFRMAPYTSWFNPSFEPLLRGLGASYYDGASSAVLHTDLCSPLATDPTWSRLGPQEHAALEPAGRGLWHALVEALQPDIVLISVRRRALSKITFPLVEAASVIYTVDGSTRSRPYHVEAFRHELASGKAPLFVFGQASQTPFGSISGVEKQRIGVRIQELLDA
jgi:hypothetical protein